MNWFQRYGIPGLYFSLYVFLCVFSSYFNVNEFCRIKAIGPVVLTILGALSLPAGYLISIFSQCLYYKVFYPQHIHRYIVPEHMKSKEDLEESLEAKTVEIFRVKAGRNVDVYRWTSEWISKRVDVIAINNSIIVATVFGVFLSRLLCNYIFHRDLLHKDLIVWISITIIILMFWNTYILLSQVRPVTKGLYESQKKVTTRKKPPLGKDK